MKIQMETFFRLKLKVFSTVVCISFSNYSPIVKILVSLFVWYNIDCNTRLLVRQAVSFSFV